LGGAARADAGRALFLAGLDACCGRGPGPFQEAGVMIAEQGRRRAQRGVHLLPAQALVLLFLTAILIGTALLSLPQAAADGTGAGVVTALFTATSAVCVTGLVVVDTGSFWSPLGQVVIMLLIQVGGLGIMTMSTLIALVLGKRISLRERILIQESMGQWSLTGIVRLTQYILLLTFVVESVGALLLTLRLAADYPLGRAAYLGLFHAVSAFNNAGFDLFGTSLVQFRGDLWTNLVVIGLVLIGGVGFVVVADVYTFSIERRRLTLQTRLVLLVSAALLLVGFGTVALLEGDNPATLGGLPWGERLLAAFFHSVTPRTAGFNTIEVGDMRTPTLLVTMVLMFIGGSPNSTAGGIKTTTFAAVVAAVLATVRGRDEVEVLRRRLGRDITDRALAIMAMALFMVVGVAMLLSITEGLSLRDVMFETTSAFGTVGLSTGVTPGLSLPGRLIIIATMFTGRLGPLTLAVALAQRQRLPQSVRYPEEKIMVG